MYCFTRKTLVGANRVRIHLSAVKQIVLRVKRLVLSVKWMNCDTSRKVNRAFTRKTRKTKILPYFNVLFYA